jgi:Flp pilus assembly protein TadG
MKLIAQKALTEVRKRRGQNCRKGAELMEFTLCFLPLTVIIGVLLSASWGVYAKTTLANAVHQGVRQGITIDSDQAAGTTLTAMVKNIVQRNSMGLLAGTSGLSKIHVDYFRVSAANSSVLTTVTQANGGLSAGDIMQVSIQGYSLPGIFPRYFGLGSTPDAAPTGFSAVAADRIEPFPTLPSI